MTSPPHVSPPPVFHVHFVLSDVSTREGVSSWRKASTKVPVKAEVKAPAARGWHPLETLRREIDRAFEDFDRGSWLSPFGRSVCDMKPFLGTKFSWAAPAVDIVDKGNAYGVTVELPGLDEKNVEVKLVNGNLTIKGEKKEEKEEKKEDYYLRERNFGSFERSLSVPEGVDADKKRARVWRRTISMPM